jgi:hypothetical protein
MAFQSERFRKRSTGISQTLGFLVAVYDYTLLERSLGLISLLTNITHISRDVRKVEYLPPVDGVSGLRRSFEQNQK